MRISELLTMRGFDLGARTKLVRHLDPTLDLRAFYRDGWLDTYQAYTAPGIFSACDYIVSFLGEEDMRARFVGVYRVQGSRPSAEVLTPAGFPLPQASSWGTYYDLAPVTGYEDFQDRVVIRWRGRGWHQWLARDRDWEVTEILPRGRVRPFPGYLEVLLGFDELREVVAHPEANRDWHIMLAVAGVYLITDRQTGNLYVGSATGARGILGRWTSYAADGHGGNKALLALVGTDPAYARNFQFSILRTLPPDLHRAELVRQEQLYKSKLGSRAHGLNEN
jgi:hypothetical protein